MRLLFLELLMKAISQTRRLGWKPTRASLPRKKKKLARGVGKPGAQCKTLSP